MRPFSFLLALFCLFAFSVLPSKGETASMHSDFLLYPVTLPDAAAYPRYEDYLRGDGRFDEPGFAAAAEAADRLLASRPVPADADYDAQHAFLRRALPVLLGGDGTQNALCSPLSLYFSLGLLAEMTQGETQRQILQLLDASGPQQLAQRLTALWYAAYAEDGVQTSRLAGSVWLDDHLAVNHSLLRQLAQQHFLSVYQGDTGSEGLNLALRQWLNQQTDDLLQDQASALSMDDETALALVTTICFKAPWADAFSSAPADVFCAPAGDRTVAYMRRSYEGYVYETDRFSGVTVNFSDGGQMRLALPQNDEKPGDLLTDDQLLAFLCMRQDSEWPQLRPAMIHLTLPRFDAACEMSLRQSLQQLGITDAFQPALADFSPAFPQTDSPALSEVLHAVRVKADEQGVAAAAYTAMLLRLGAAALPQEEVTLTFNRPFLFEIVGRDGSILFAGIINQP